VGLRIATAVSLLLPMANLQPTVIGESCSVDSLHKGDVIQAVRSSCRQAIEKTDIEVWNGIAEKVCRARPCS
jgi:hypothetical protein